MSNTNHAATEGQDALRAAECQSLLSQLISLLMPGTPSVSCAMAMRAVEPQSRDVLMCSDDLALRIATLTAQMREGPALDADGAGVAVSAYDLSLHADRWPVFTVLARAQGVRSAHSEPLSHQGTSLGTLSWYSCHVGALSRIARDDFAAAAAATSMAIGSILDSPPFIPTIRRDVAEAVIVDPSLQTLRSA